MYALAIYDNKSKLLSLVRDPAGIKPIIAPKHQKVGYSHPSMIKFLNIHGLGKEREINPESLAEYLQLGYIPSPNALF